MMMSICPFVMGSNVPGKTSVFTVPLQDETVDGMDEDS